jgi:hypothetical protein
MKNKIKEGGKENSASHRVAGMIGSFDEVERACE